MGTGAWRRAQAVLLTLVSIEVLVLLATGVYLWFEYRPTAADGWDELYDLRPEVADAVRVALVHRWTSVALVPTAIAAAVVTFVGPARRADLHHALRAVALVLVLPAALYTGYLLAWDQLALRSVTVGTDLSGLQAILAEDVRFVLVDGVEVDPGTVIAWFGVHVGLTLVLVGAVASAWWSARRRPPPEPAAEVRI